MTITRHNRFWKVLDEGGTLICLTVYRKGAEEVVRRLQAHPAAPQSLPWTGSRDDTAPPPRPETEQQFFPEQA
jgi:hypothetical protein